MNRNQRETVKGAFLPEAQNLFAQTFFAGFVMVASLFSMLFKCVSSWQGGVSLWLMICHNDIQKMFSHFTLVLESELSNVLETCTRAAWLLNLSIKEKSAKIDNYNRNYSTKCAKVCRGGNPYLIYSQRTWRKIMKCITLHMIWYYRTWKRVPVNEKPHICPKLSVPKPHESNFPNCWITQQHHKKFILITVVHWSFDIINKQPKRFKPVLFLYT